jgi:EAL domain-containing protein (putative c-di-GMP-specific phosphodiesterase class I)
MDEKKTAKIIFVTDNEDDYKNLSGMLGGLEYAVEHHLCRDLTAIKAECGIGRCDLILYWYKSGLIKDKELVEFIKAAPEPPALLLAADSIASGDYVQASSMGAVDILNTQAAAQFPFVVQREIKNARVRRQYTRMAQKYQEEQVVDETEFELPEETDAMSPMVTTIDEALKTNQMELLFQPILAVQDDGYDNYEVFLRIKKKEGGYIMPNDFLPVAEQFGLMPAIDRWVVKSAVTRFKAEQDVRKLKNQNRKLRFFINISGHSLIDEVIMASIVVEMGQAKLNPGNFVIEVHKNTILSRLPKAKTLNQNVKKLQFEFAINHYEESDKSLNYLKHVSLDFIKLNKQLLGEMATSKQKRDSVREIVDHAHQSDIRVIASQVEDAKVLPILYEVGVDYIQGYLIAEPGTRLERAVIDASLDEAAFN